MVPVTVDTLTTEQIEALRVEVAPYDAATIELCDELLYLLDSKGDSVDIAGNGAHAWADEVAEMKRTVCAIINARAQQ